MPASPPAPGDHFADRFHLERRAGHGAFGTVFRARDLTNDRVVAIKIWVGPEDETRRFETEARLLATIRHPSIVSYVEHGRSRSGYVYLAMEWLEGEDLAERLDRARLTVDETVVLGTRLAQALGVLHERGVVHRDVKPGNVFLPAGKAAECKLIDFGIARVADRTRGLTRPGYIVGTPGYMAPEQACPGEAIDGRTDLWALGCVLFECLVGRPAFVGRDAAALLAKSVLEEPPRVGDLRPEVPASLDEVVAALLAKDPAERVQDAREVVEILSVVERGAVRVASVSPVATTLTTEEKRLVALLFTLAPLERLGALAAAHGGRYEELIDGACLVAWEGDAAAADLASRAAYCALAASQSSEEPVALVMGTGGPGPAGLGDVIDRAAALLSDAATLIGRGGGRRAARAVLVDHLTATLLDARFSVDTSHSPPMLLGEDEAREAPRMLLGKETPFVGRGAALDLLRSAVGACVEERAPRAVLVTAPAGVGKSRLRQELVRRVRAEMPAVEVWQGQGDPLRAGSPYGILGRAVRRGLGIADGASPAQATKRLRARVGAHFVGADAVRVGEFVGELFGIPWGGEPSAPLRAARGDLQLMGEQRRRAWLDWLAAECAARPLLLVLEDFHWGDLATTQLLVTTLVELRDRPLLVLVLARPELETMFPDLWRAERATQVELPGLPDRAAERLVREVLGDAADAAVVAGILARAAGNALYVEELIRAASQPGSTAPGTVLALLHARIGALSLEERRALRAASVYGDEFTSAGVAALLGAEDVAPRLARLAAEDLVVALGTSRYRFRHDLIREAAYALLTDEDRALGHRLAGDFLERTGERDPLVLAEHFEHGGDAERARTCYRLAAAQALDAGDFAATLAHAARAIAGGATGAELGELRLLEAGVHRWRADYEQQETCAREAMRWLPCGSDSWWRAVDSLAEVVDATKEPDLTATMEDALDGAEPMQSSTTAFARIAVMSLQRHGFRAWEGFARRFEALESGPWGHVPIVHAARALEAHMSGDTWRALQAVDRASRALREAGDDRLAWMSDLNRARALGELGMYAQAIDLLVNLDDEAARVGVGVADLWARQVRGYFLGKWGCFEEAARIGVEVATACEAAGVHGAADGWFCLAECELLRGNVDLARRHAMRGQALAPKQELWSGGAYAFGVLAEVHRACGDTAAALEAAHVAVQKAEPFRILMKGDAFVRLAWPRALDAAGRTDEARTALAAAARTLRERAARIGDESVRAGFLERVPEHARTLALCREWNVD